MAALPVSAVPLGAVTSAVAGVQATVAQGVAGALFTAQFAEPVIVYTVSAEVNSVLTAIPVVGVTAAGVAATVISELTVALGPGSSTIFQVVGSVTALVGTVTEVVPVVVASATSALGGGVMATALPTGSLPVTLSTSLPVTLPGGSAGSSTAVATGSSSLAVQSGSSASATTTLAKFTNAAVLMQGAPNNKLMGLMTLMTLFVSLMFGSGFLLMQI